MAENIKMEIVDDTFLKIEPEFNKIQNEAVLLAYLRHHQTVEKIFEQFENEKAKISSRYAKNEGCNIVINEIVRHNLAKKAINFLQEMANINMGRIKLNNN